MVRSHSHVLSIGTETQVEAKYVRVVQTYALCLLHSSSKQNLLKNVISQFMFISHSKKFWDMVIDPYLPNVVNMVSSE